MIKKILPILALSFSLQGCIFVAGAAIGAAGIAVVYDHRKLEAVMQDQDIGNAVIAKLKATPDFYNQGTHINVTCFNRIVLLTGETTTKTLRDDASNLAQNVSGVKRVYNEIIVKGPTSPLTRASDTWITTKIKTEMLATQDLKSSTIKVVTENGTVYLMGIVSHAQADMSVDIARQVAGVQKVIKIFQYTD